MTNVQYMQEEEEFDKHLYLKLKRFCEDISDF